MHVLTLSSVMSLQTVCEEERYTIKVVTEENVEELLKCSQYIGEFIFFTIY